MSICHIVGASKSHSLLSAGCWSARVTDRRPVVSPATCCRALSISKTCILWLLFNCRKLVPLTPFDCMSLSQKELPLTNHISVIASNKLHLRQFVCSCCSFSHVGLMGPLCPFSYLSLPRVSFIAFHMSFHLLLSGGIRVGGFVLFTFTSSRSWPGTFWND